MQAEQREEGSPQAAPTIADALTPASLEAVNMEVASGKLPTEVTDDIEAASSITFGRTPRMFAGFGGAQPLRVIRPMHRNGM